ILSWNVYDPLGIPRKNIIGLEYDREKAERLTKAGLGISVVCSSDLDFFKKINQTFTIISLDYTGQKTWRERDVERYIAGRGLLENTGIFMANHSVRRESEKM